jgi:peptidoglycan/LPS O-acetylase OafA/YrhL
MQLSKETSNLYKGLGILLIVLHNYFHNIPPLIGQNEFYFNLLVTERFVQAMLASPTEWVRAVFSYLAHYGVQLFIFLSAYGLAKRYSSEDVEYAEFLKTRFGKIYLSFVICVAVYICLGVLKSALLPDEKVLFWDSLLWKLLLVSNIIPGEAMSPVGPWWFLPFILQFYLVFPFLLRAYRRTGTHFLVILSLAAMIIEWAVNPFLMRHGVNLNYIFIGHLPVFCLGIYFSGNPGVKITFGLGIAALGIFILGCVNPIAWIASDLGATVLLLVLLGWYTSTLSSASTGYRVVSFYGKISFHLFLVNGFLRGPFHQMAVSLDKWWLTILLGILSLLFSTAFAVMLRRVDYQFRNIISRN